MNKQVTDLLEQAGRVGWVMEPAAKQVLRLYDLPVTRFHWAHSLEEAIEGAGRIAYPLVAKIVSPLVVHKSDVGGVVVGVRDDRQLTEIFERFESMPGFDGILLDEMIAGTELIIGAKQDPQFGTVVLTGIGGTSVEVYRDVSIRLAPLTREDALNALESLRGHVLLEGYRGRDPIAKQAVVELLTRFSSMAHELRELVDSIDLNPVFCTKDEARIADARFILKSPVR
jgi:acetate---CoA ligase (ADP-forming) subunit beta